MQDWQKNLLTYSLGGAGVGALGSLVLNALYHSRKNRTSPEDLVPRSIVERPFFVSPEQSKILESRGIQPRTPGKSMMKAAREKLYAEGRSLMKIAARVAKVEPVAAMPKTAGWDWLKGGLRDVALPALAGLGSGWLAFRGVDNLVDSMYRDSAKDQYDDKRKRLEALMGQMYSGLDKVAEDWLDNGHMVDVIPQILNFEDQVLEKTAEWYNPLDWPGHAADAAGNVGSSLLGGPASTYGKWLVAAPLAAGLAFGIPAGLKAYKKNDKNKRQLEEIEQYYRDLPMSTKVKMIPYLKKTAEALGTDQSTVTPDTTPKPVKIDSADLLKPTPNAAVPKPAQPAPTPTVPAV